MAVIYTNMASLNAQNNLMKSQNDLQTSLQRLSSGLRINSAMDDAAGLAIANRMTSQINGLNIAIRNANDGISLAQTAEGAMQEATNILQRMRELALQSANGGNGDSERKALNDEVVQLKNELDRIATTTRFGSKELFNGEFAENIQIGARANETISVKIESIRTTEMGTRASREASAASLTATSEVTSLTIDATNDEFSISIDGGTTDIAIAIDAGTYTSVESLADNINQQIADSSLSGEIRAYIDEGKLQFKTTATGSTATIDLTDTDALTNLGFTTLTAAGTDEGPDTTASIELIDISTTAGAQDAIAAIDAALKEVDTTRATLGAIQSRFESTISNLTNVAENVTAARSRIQDADFAQETANLTRAQILQQAGTSILAQANTLPQLVLALLQ